VTLLFLVIELIYNPVLNNKKIQHEKFYTPHNNDGGDNPLSIPTHPAFTGLVMPE